MGSTSRLPAEAVQGSAGCPGPRPLGFSNDFKDGDSAVLLGQGSRQCTPGSAARLPDVSGSRSRRRAPGSVCPAEREAQQPPAGTRGRDRLRERGSERGQLGWAGTEGGTVTETLRTRPGLPSGATLDSFSRSGHIPEVRPLQKKVMGVCRC